MRHGAVASSACGSRSAAARRRLVRQLLTESLLLASMGMAAGLVLAYWGTRGLATMADAGPLDLSPDLTVLAFVAGTTLLTGIGFGIAPALGSTRGDLGRIGDTTRPSRRRSHARQRLSRTLVLIQVALSLALLVGAGLLVRTMRNLGNVDLGFRPEHVLLFDVAHSLRRGTLPADVAQVAAAVHQRVREIPGVESASLSTIPLFSDTDLYAPVRILHSDTRLDARFNSVSPGYFETLGMTLLDGRTIQPSDTREPLVAVINQSMARKYFPSRFSGWPVDGDWDCQHGGQADSDRRRRAGCEVQQRARRNQADVLQADSAVSGPNPCD